MSGVTVDQVRRFMRDYPATNVLLDQVEFSTPEIEQGVEMVTSLYNTVTPSTSFTCDNWPPNSNFLMLMGVAWYLLQGEAMRQLRNQHTYQDGDIAPIGVDDKYTLYQNAAQSLRAEWMQLVKDSKIQRNLEAGYGHLSSGYRNTSRHRYS